MNIGEWNSIPDHVPELPISEVQKYNRALCLASLYLRSKKIFRMMTILAVVFSLATIVLALENYALNKEYNQHVSDSQKNYDTANQIIAEQKKVIEKQNLLIKEWKMFGEPQRPDPIVR